MDQESKNTVPDGKLKSFVKEWGQMIFTVSSVIFASGSLYAKVNDIKDKTDRLDFVSSTTEVQQGRLSERINTLTDSQKAQSEATNKLADAVNRLSNQVSKMEGRQESKRR